MRKVWIILLAMLLAVLPVFPAAAAGADIIEKNEVTGYSLVVYDEAYP